MSIHIFKNKKKLAKITEQSFKLSLEIESNRDKLIKELLEYESYDTIQDEITHSLDCLKNVSKEFKWLGYGKVNLLCSFLPINLPLYSLVTFGIIPSFIADNTVVRPPVLTSKVFKKIARILNLHKLTPSIKITDIERYLFNEAYVSVADVIIFTGRYKNAKIVQKISPKNALFIYDGAGVNPIIVTNSANIDLAVQKIIKTRIFNSGQDCAGPDVIFIHEKISNHFKRILLSNLKKIKVGEYQNRAIKVGPLLTSDSFPIIEDFFNNHRKSIIHGGKIDFKKKIIYPTVIVEDAHKVNFFATVEFFSPIFYVIVYHNNNDLKRYLSQKNYSDFAMYVSIFGEIAATLKIPNSVVLRNQIINDVESGNDPYGGYGSKANYVSYSGIEYHRPLLISREIYGYLKSRCPKEQV